MVKKALRSVKGQSILTSVIALMLCAGTANSAPKVKGAATGKYVGLFKEQQSGSTNNFKVTNAPGDLFRFQMHGTYASAVGGNFGDIDCKAKIANDLAVLKQKNWKDNCGVWTMFNNDLALVVQNGDPIDLQLGNNVNFTGIYRRTVAGGTKQKPPLSANKPNAHFEKADGTLAFEGTFDDATPFKEERAVVTRRAKKGFIDLQGRQIVPFRFDDAHDFYDGLAAVTIDGKKWGYIDNNGNFKIKPIYDYAWDFSEGRGAVAIGKKFFWIDKTDAKNTDKSWERVGSFSNDLGPVQQGELWGLVNQKGDEVVPCRYLEPLQFKDGLAAFKNKDNKLGYIDTTGKEVIPAAFDQANDFSEGLAAVQTNERIGFIDKSGNKVIPDQFKEVFGAFSNGRCLVRKAGSPYISVIDKAGKQLQQLPLQIRDITPFGQNEGATICHSLDFNFDSNGHDIPLDKNYKLLPAFANKDVKYWSEAGLFVVSGSAPSSKTNK